LFFVDGDDGFSAVEFPFYLTWEFEFEGADFDQFILR